MGECIDFKSNMTFVMKIQPLIKEKQPVQGAAEVLAAQPWIIPGHNFKQ